MREPKKKASVARERSDKRSQLLIYMKPELVRDLKVAALTRGQPAYVLAEIAIDEWLKKQQRESRRTTAKSYRSGKS